MYDYDTVRPTVLLDCGAPAPSKPIKKATPFGVVFFMVEVAGVEPASESTSSGLSPGADGYCGILHPCSHPSWQAVTPAV